MSTTEQAFVIKGGRGKNQKGLDKRGSKNHKSKRKNSKHRRALQNFDTYEYLSGINLERDYIPRSQSSQNQLKKLDVTHDTIRKIEERFEDTISSDFPPPPKDSTFNLISVSSCIDQLITHQMITHEKGLQIQNAIQLMQSSNEAVKYVRDDLFDANQSEVKKIQKLMYQIVSCGVDVLGRLWQEDHNHFTWEEILNFFQEVTDQIFVIQKVFEQYSRHAENWDLSAVVQRHFQNLIIFMMESQEDLLSAKNLNPELMFVHSVQERAKSLKQMWKRGFEIVQKLGEEWSQFKCIFKFQWALVLRKAAIQMEVMQHTVPGWDDVENSPFLRMGIQENNDYENEYSDWDESEENLDVNGINNIYGSGGILSNAFLKGRQAQIDQQDTAWVVASSSTEIYFDDKIMEAYAWLVDILKVLFHEGARIVSEMEGDIIISEYYSPELKTLMKALHCKNMQDFLADLRIKFSELAITSLGCALALGANPNALEFWALQKLEEHSKKCLALIKQYDKSVIGIGRIMHLNIEDHNQNHEFRKVWKQITQKQVNMLRNYNAGLWNALFKVQQLITITSRKQQEEQNKEKITSVGNLQQQQYYEEQLFEFQVGPIIQQQSTAAIPQVADILEGVVSNALPPSPFATPSPGPEMIQSAQIKINDSAIKVSDVTESPIQNNTTNNTTYINTDNIIYIDTDDNACICNDNNRSSICAPAYQVRPSFKQGQSSSMPQELEDQIEKLVTQGDEFWRCQFKDVTFDESLKHSSFSVVFKVWWTPWPQSVVAFKHFKLGEQGVEEKVVRQFIREAQIYKQLGKHENVMYCHGVIISLDRSNKDSQQSSENTSYLNDGSQRSNDDQSEINDIIPSEGLKLGLLLEFCEVGTIMQLIENAREIHQSKQKKPIEPNNLCPGIRLYCSWRMRLDLALQTAKGLKHIHDNNIVHRDLTSYNVMLKWSKNNQNQKKLVCKVGDFNLSKAIVEMNGNSIELHSPEWQADEIIYSEHANYSKESDIFSIGIILWELITLRLPWRDKTQSRLAVIELRRNGQRLELCEERIQGPPLMREAFDELSTLVLQCQDLERTQRPSLGNFIERITKIRDLFKEDECIF